MACSTVAYFTSTGAKKKKKLCFSPSLSYDFVPPSLFSFTCAPSDQPTTASHASRALDCETSLSSSSFFFSQETLTFISPAPLHSSLLSSSDSLTTPRQKKDSHPNDRPCLRHPLRPKGVGTPLEPAAEARRRRRGRRRRPIFFCHAPQFFFLSLFFAPCYHTPRSGGGLGEPVNLPI